MFPNIFEKLDAKQNNKFYYMKPISWV